MLAVINFIRCDGHIVGFEVIDNEVSDKSQLPIVKMKLMGVINTPLMFWLMFVQKLTPTRLVNYS